MDNNILKPTTLKLFEVLNKKRERGEDSPSQKNSSLRLSINQPEKLKIIPTDCKIKMIKNQKEIEDEIHKKIIDKIVNNKLLRNLKKIFLQAVL